MGGEDPKAVHRLARAHPDVAQELYEFFAFMIETHRSVDGQTRAKPKPFLALVRDATGESVHAIAAAMDVTADFLVDLTENGGVLPMAARAELIRRARSMRVTHDINEDAALESFDVLSLRRAASRDQAYPASNLTYTGLVERSGLSEEQKRFWLGLV